MTYLFDALYLACEAYRAALLSESESLGGITDLCGEDGEGTSASAAKRRVTLGDVNTSTIVPHKHFVSTLKKLSLRALIYKDLLGVPNSVICLLSTCVK
jgi:hypothetical protein